MLKSRLLRELHKGGVVAQSAKNKGSELFFY